MKKKANAVAAIIVVVTLVAGTSIVLFNPFKQEDTMINYAEQISYFRNRIQKDLYDLQNEFFHSRDDSYWYFNFTSYPPMNTTLEKIINNSYSPDGNYEFKLVGVVYNSSELFYPNLSNISNVNEFILQQNNINVTFENLFERRMINKTIRYTSGEIFDLYKGLYLWLEQDAGNLSLKLRTQLYINKNITCRFGYCSCELLNETTIEEHKQTIIEEYGIEESHIRDAVLESIEELNVNFLNETNFDCSIDINNETISIINEVRLEFNISETCDTTDSLQELGNNGTFYQGRHELLTNNERTRPPGDFLSDENIIDPPITFSKGPEIPDDDSLPTEVPPEKENPLAYYFNLHKKAEAEFKITCSNNQINFDFWIYFSLQRQCDDNSTLEDNNNELCPKEEEEPEPDPDPEPGPGPGPEPDDCDVCEVPQLIEDEWFCVPAPKNTPCGSNVCMDLGCNGTSSGIEACTEEIGFNENNPCNPNDLNDNSNLEQYCTICGNDGSCNTFAPPDQVCEQGFCGNLLCNGTTNECNNFEVKLENEEEPCETWKFGGDDPLYKSTCTICGEDGLCQTNAPPQQVCGETKFCYEETCSGEGYGTDECNQITGINTDEPCNPNNLNQGGDNYKSHCAICNSTGECNVPAETDQICESGGNNACSDKVCNGNFGPDACTNYLPRDGMENTPCSAWNNARDTSSRRATCTICGEDGLCQKEAPPEQLCGQTYCMNKTCSGTGYGADQCNQEIPKNIGDPCDPSDNRYSGTIKQCAICNIHGECVAAPEGTHCDDEICRKVGCIGGQTGTTACTKTIEYEKYDGDLCNNINECVREYCDGGTCSNRIAHINLCTGGHEDCNVNCNINTGECSWFGDCTTTIPPCDDELTVDGTCVPNTGACNTNYQCCESGNLNWICLDDRECCIWEDTDNLVCPIDENDCPEFGV